MYSIKTQYGERIAREAAWKAYYAGKGEWSIYQCYKSPSGAKVWEAEKLRRQVFQEGGGALRFWPLGTSFFGAVWTAPDSETGEIRHFYATGRNVYSCPAFLDLLERGIV